MNKKIIKLSTLLFLLLTLTVILTGCTQRPSLEESTENVIKEMEKVYGDKFTYISSCSRGTDDLFGKNPTREVILESEELPNKEIKVLYNYDDYTGNYNYQKCYYNLVKYEEKILEELAVLDEIYDEYKVLLLPTNDDMVKLSYDEYTKSENTIQLYVIVSPKASKLNKEKDFEKLRKSLEENELFISRINIFYTNEGVVFDELDSKNEEEIMDYARENGGTEGIFYLDEDYKTKDMSRWLERKKSEL